MQNSLTAKRPILWSIAGSDCSGGAGIQADVKTGHLLGMEVCTLITANTIQNSHQLVAINPVSTSVLQNQMKALLADKLPTAIKIGMIANNAQLDWLISAIEKLQQNQPGLVIVWDPVVKATVGDNLTEEALNHAQLLVLMRLATAITPNWPEAAFLSQQEIEGEPKDWAYPLIERGVKAVLITGGHGLDAKQIVDSCFIGDQIFELVSNKNHTGYGHGSGCTLSTALASFLAQGYLLRDAFMHAQAFMNKAFALCPHETDYYGALIQPCWPVEKTHYPEPVLQSPVVLDEQQGFPSIGIQALGLYPVVGSYQWLKRLMPSDLEIIQLRLKNQTEKQLRENIASAVALAKRYPYCRLFINDYWELAIEYGAYGVHLGQEDLLALSQSDFQKLKQSGVRLGVSTHGVYEFLLAQQIQPSYLAIGAIFPTKTKDMTGQIQGIENLQHLLDLRSASIPVVAIGGITLANAEQVIKTGVDSIAVVTAITESEDYQSVVTEFKTLLKS